jgi:hypothetical protein
MSDAFGPAKAGRLSRGLAPGLACFAPGRKDAALRAGEAELVAASGCAGSCGTCAVKLDGRFDVRAGTKALPWAGMNDAVGVGDQPGTLVRS